MARSWYRGPSFEFTLIRFKAGNTPEIVSAPKKRNVTFEKRRNETQRAIKNRSRLEEPRIRRVTITMTV